MAVAESRLVEYRGTRGGMCEKRMEETVKKRSAGEAFRRKLE
jgi:hypothetical protein